MKKSIISFFLLVSLVASSAFAAETAHVSMPSGGTSVATAPAGDIVIEVTDRGIASPQLNTELRQGMIFFFNNTTSSLITIEVDFGNKALTCFSSATPGIEFNDSGTLVSTRPIAPGNFVSSCFPRPGKYPYRIYGLRPGGQPVSGIISVLME